MVSVVDDVQSINDEEERRLKAFKEFGYELPKGVASYNMIVKVYIREKRMIYEKKKDSSGLIIPGAMEERQSVIIIPEEITEDDAYISVVGMVIAQGPDCYPKERNPSGPSCRIGDWINFKNNAGELRKYRGVWVRTIPDDTCQMTLEDPNYVTRD